MAGDETNLLLVVLIAVVSVVGVALATTSVATNRSFQGMMGGGGGGGMMGGGATGNTSAQSVGQPGALEWTVLALSLVFLGAAVVIFARGRMRPSGSSPVVGTPAPFVAQAPSPPAPATPVVPATVAPTVAASPPGAAVVAEPVPEPALMKLLDQDERTLYLEIRDHGGSMLQRDLVALGVFSKAKVTRVLDRLEAKDLVVREAHGMTNRVRIVHPAK